MYPVFSNLATLYAIFTRSSKLCLTETIYSKPHRFLPHALPLSFVSLFSSS